MGDSSLLCVKQLILILVPYHTVMSLECWHMHHIVVSATLPLVSQADLQTPQVCLSVTAACPVEPLHSMLKLLHLPPQLS